MKRTINPRAVLIQKRFFEALEYVFSHEDNVNMKGFCEKNQLNRVKYARLKSDINKPIEEMAYKTLDVDALAALCDDYNISCEWLLLGKGNMLNKQDKKI